MISSSLHGAGSTGLLDVEALDDCQCWAISESVHVSLPAHSLGAACAHAASEAIMSSTASVDEQSDTRGCRPQPKLSAS